MDNSFDKLINRVLDGRYKIENVLGIGGMAYVLKATDLQNKGRTVAIKILNDEFNKDETSVKRFVNESEAVSMISAPNIVEIHDVVISDTLKYIVMEYIDGITLKDYIDKIGSLGWREAVHYIKQILLGLSAAHEKGIIHRDVKPQNIMLLNDGKVKVTDFGIAKLPKAEPLTMTDKAIGTVNYISPEQASGGKVDTKSDIYSTGVMLYEMVTGRLPFTADSPVAVAMMQVSDEPVPPRQINSAVPVGLEQIILKAMSKDPEARFSSANAMIKALDYFVKNPTVVFAQSENSSGNGKNRALEEKKHESAGNTSRPMYPIILGITLAFFTVAIISGIYLIMKADVSHKDGFSGVDKLLGVDGNNSDERKMLVEDFIGKTYDDEFKAYLTENGYSVAKVIYDRVGNRAENSIINQDPEPGATRIKPEGGKTIELTLYVNMGAVETKMPDCGYTEKETAKRYLTNEFNSVLIENYDTECIKIEEVFSDTVPRDFVIETKPAAGDVITVTKDIEVTLYVSKGPEKQTVTMPNVVGRPEGEARRLILESGLSLGQTRNEYSSAQPAGFVIRASIPAGEEVEDKETAVDITVSLGVKPEGYLSGNGNNASDNNDNSGAGAGGLEALLGMRENNEQ